MTATAQRAFVKLYLILGLDPDQLHISQADIKKAFYARSKECHPDAEGGSEELQAELNAAYEVLGDPKLRAKYDATGVGEKEVETPEVKGAEMLYTIVESVLEEMAEGGDHPSGFAAMLMSQLGGGRGPKLDFNQVDFVKRLHKALDIGRKNAQKKLRVHKDEVGRLDDIIGRLEFKGKSGTPDVLGGMLKTQRGMHEEAVTKLNEKLDELKAVEDLLNNYTYFLPPAAPQPEQRGATSFNDLIGRRAEISIRDLPPEFFDPGKENDRYNRKKPR